MRERPILFSAPMVRAILAGRKSQTRRVVKPTMTAPRVAPLYMKPWVIDGEWQEDDQGLPCWAGEHPDYPTGEKWFSCPYGKPGDQLWVRETWHLWGPPERQILEYRADCSDPDQYTWKPSIHMPRKYSRITLDITGVRVERLQDISEADAQAEGVAPTAAGNGYPFAMPARMNFVDLWDGLNAARGYGWAENPWVWVISFRRILEDGR